MKGLLQQDHNQTIRIWLPKNTMRTCSLFSPRTQVNSSSSGKSLGTWLLCNHETPAASDGIEFPFRPWRIVLMEANKPPGQRYAQHRIQQSLDFWRNVIFRYENCFSPMKTNGWHCWQLRNAHIGIKVDKRRRINKKIDNEIKNKRRW